MTHQSGSATVAYLLADTYCTIVSYAHAECTTVASVITSDCMMTLRLSPDEPKDTEHFTESTGRSSLSGSSSEDGTSLEASLANSVVEDADDVGCLIEEPPSEIFREPSAWTPVLPLFHAEEYFWDTGRHLYEEIVRTQAGN